MGYRGMELLESHGDEHPRERRSDAAVTAGPESQVRLADTAQDQVARYGEDLPIAVRRRNGRQDGIADPEFSALSAISALSAREAGVSHDDPARGLRRVEPQQLLDRERDLVIVLQQREPILPMRAEMVKGADQYADRIAQCGSGEPGGDAQHLGGPIREIGPPCRAVECCQQTPVIDRPVFDRPQDVLFDHRVARLPGGPRSWRPRFWRPCGGRGRTVTRRDPFPAHRSRRIPHAPHEIP